MPALSLAEWQIIRDAYQAALLAVLKGQAYQIGGRSFKRADLKEVRAGLAEANTMVDRLGGSGGIRLRGARPS